MNMGLRIELDQQYIHQLCVRVNKTIITMKIDKFFILASY